MNRMRYAICFGLVIAGFAAWFALPARVAADDKGAVEGAIWRYTLTRAAGRAQEMRGRFRIHGKEIFQSVRGEESIVVGTIDGKWEPPKGVVNVTFEKLRGSDMQERSFKGKLHYAGTPTMPGKAEGRLVDGAGFHWTFKAERIRE